MELKELFKEEENRNIVINTDIDGVLSGLFLVKYCDCKIVGFTNSKDKVWLADGYDNLYKNTYVDMFVTNPKAKCIDQHIIAINKDHLDKIRANRVLISPQCEDDTRLQVFTKESFNNKYPFGTFQYLVAKLENEGYQISLPNLDNDIKNSSIKVGDLLSRPDDAMNSTLVKYIENASSWWEWLKNMAPINIGILKQYIDKIGENSDNKVTAIPLPPKKKHKKDEFKKQREKDVKDIKDRTKQYFKDSFNCNSTDCDYQDVIDDNRKITRGMENYLTTIGSIIGLKDVSIKEHFNVHKGEVYRTRWIDLFEPDFVKDFKILNKDIFSYAFIFGPEGDGKYTNFSFTINMI